jgi:bifunctional non-homologous end joining protein LigD
VPSGERWLHEIKFDGYRVQLHIANEDIKVFTRRGNDWTKRFKKIAADAYLINGSSAIIDGEIVVPAADGTTDFSVLQNELKGRSTKIVMVAFDLLYLDGYDLRKLPLIERKSHLKKLIAKTSIQFSESFEVDGAEMYQHACAVGLEGVVSKVRDSRYNSGRGNEWMKKTCAQRETLTSRALRSMVANGMASTLDGARARTWSMLGRSITASTRFRRRPCARS